jgi:NTP pyrophosphatase (non-canonical NTP hydrolase)
MDKENDDNTGFVKVMTAIAQELDRAREKHPDYPLDMFQQLAIMQEEAGEVTKAVLHLTFEKGTYDAVEKELIQTAAMCIRMILNNNPWI